jgi:hypothetical membrane protein
MTTSEIITVIVVFVIAVVLAVISYRSFKNRGFLFNNAYLFASKEERETMDKKPHYKQSAIVFLLLSVVFFVIGLSIVFNDSRINLIEIPLIIGVLVYAIISSIQISRNEKK